MRVVDRLEQIEVEHHEGKGEGPRSGAPDQLAQAGLEGTEVVEAGQIVGVREHSHLGSVLGQDRGDQSHHEEKKGFQQITGLVPPLQQCGIREVIEQYGQERGHDSAAASESDRGPDDGQVVEVLKGRGARPVIEESNQDERNRDQRDGVSAAGRNREGMANAVAGQSHGRDRSQRSGGGGQRPPDGPPGVANIAGEPLTGAELQPGDGVEELLVQLLLLPGEPVVVRLDEPELLRLPGPAHHPLDDVHADELVPRRMDRDQRQRSHLADHLGGAEQRLLGDALGDVDDRVPEAPAQLRLVRQAERDHARHLRPYRIARRRQHRQRRAFGDAHENRWSAGASGRVVHQGGKVPRHVRRAEGRRALGEARQVGLAVEPDDEVTLAGQELGDGRAQVDPAAVAARDHGHGSAARAVHVQALLLAADGEALGRGRGGARGQREEQGRHQADYPHDDISGQAPSLLWGSAGVIGRVPLRVPLASLWVVPAGQSVHKRRRWAGLPRRYLNLTSVRSLPHRRGPLSSTPAFPPCNARERLPQALGASTSLSRVHGAGRGAPQIGPENEVPA